LSEKNENICGRILFWLAVYKINITLNKNGWLNDKYDLYKQVGMINTSGIDKSKRTK